MNALSEADLNTIRTWLDGLSTCSDLNEVCADGGITVGMVYQQDAREFSGRISRILDTLKEDDVDASNDPFVSWLYEFEGYGMRIERLSEDLRDPLDKLMPWLRAAYEVGLNAKK